MRKADFMGFLDRKDVKGTVLLTTYIPNISMIIDK